MYRWLAEQLDVEGPTVDDERAPDRGSKRCRNDLLRSLGYAKALSVAGGFQAWKKLQAAGAEAPAPAPSAG